ncbi:hypothetical protein VCV18_012461 [Metarhizium anisopliae]
MVALDRVNHSRPQQNAPMIPEADQYNGVGKVHSSVNHNLVDKALIRAIYAFSIRWLHLRSPSQPHETRNLQTQLESNLWHCAAELMHAIVSQPCYRSILALQLFSETTVPADAHDEGIAELCQTASLAHYMKLYPASLLNEPKFLSSKVAGAAKEDPTHLPMQDTALWLGCISDVARSIRSHRPLMLLAGRSAETKVWGYIRERAHVFDNSFKHLHSTPEVLPPEVVSIILQNASACKTMFWWNIVRVRNALYDPAGDESVTQTMEKALQEYHRFQGVFAPFLDICSRNFQTLGQEAQLHYLADILVLLVIHFHWGALQLSSLLSQTRTAEASTAREPSSITSVQAIINAVSLISSPSQWIVTDMDFPNLILRDPFPETTVDILSTTANRILDLQAAGELSVSTAQLMVSTILDTLAVISNISRMAARTLDQLRITIVKEMIEPVGGDDTSTLF